MPTVVWVLIAVIGGLAVIYVLTAVVLLGLMKRAQKKAFSALDELVPYEKERYALLTEIQERMAKDNFVIPSNIREIIEDGGRTLGASTVDMGKVKGELDFAFLYLQKFLKEKKLLARPGYPELMNEITAHIFIDPSIKGCPYEKYDKLAYRYNAYLGMMFISPFIAHKNLPKAPIL
jgi:hypothetical protein